MGKSVACMGQSVACMGSSGACMGESVACIGESVACMPSHCVSFSSSLSPGTIKYLPSNLSWQSLLG